MIASALIALATEAAAEETWDLPMPAWAYGAIALGLGVAMLLFVWSFRNVAGNMIYGPNGPRRGQPRLTVEHSAGDAHGGGH